MLVEGAGVREPIDAPAGVEEGVPGDGLAAAVAEEAEQGNLAWREVDGRSIPLGGEGAGADGEIAESKSPASARPAVRRRAARMRAMTSPRVKGLAAEARATGKS